MLWHAGEMRVGMVDSGGGETCEGKLARSTQAREVCGELGCTNRRASAEGVSRGPVMATTPDRRYQKDRQNRPAFLAAQGKK